MTAPIRSGYALPGPGAPFSGPDHDYTTLLGRQAKLMPAGENIDLDAHLPRDGVFSQQLALSDWGTDWLVLTLNEPCPFGSYFIVRARWLNHPIGSEFCPVFVLTDPQNSLKGKQQWASADFDFTSWATIEVK